jgi:hypothetical protein
MFKLSRLYMISAVAAICLVVFLGPLYFAPLVTARGADSWLAFFLAVYAGLVGHIIVKERLIFGATKRRDKRAVRH